jgi:hypothetical protein
MSRASRSPEQKQYRTAVAMLVGAVAGLAVAIFSGLALVPRVRLVDVLVVIAGAVGGGAALVGAIGQFKHARATVRNPAQEPTGSPAAETRLDAGEASDVQVPRGRAERG